MALKVIPQNDPDYAGRYPLLVKGLNIKLLYDYLFHNYHGYKFAIIIDVTKDEWEDFPHDVPVLFLDDALEEAAEYSRKRVV